MVQDWRSFVDDQQRVRITWGDLLSYTGIIESIETDWESQTEVVWRMHILIDSDDGEKTLKSVVLPTLPPPAPDVFDALENGLPALPKHVPSLDTLVGDLFDTIDQFIQPVRSFGATAVSLANTIGNLESGTFDELQRLRAGFHQFKTAYETLSVTVDSLGDDAMLFGRQADDDLRWFGFKRNDDVDSIRLKKKIADNERLIDQFLFGKTVTVYVAKPGDSWESIATQVYGSPDNAPKIRAANGIQYGEMPEAGRQYNIPQT
jgi:hypothetical protein